MMKCFNHRDIDAIGICMNCGRAVCKSCFSIQENKIYCNLCVNPVEEKQNKESSIIMPEQRISELINKFDYYLNLSKEVIGLDSSWGEGVVEHIKVIEKIRKARNYKLLIKDDAFLEEIYETLILWGMNWRRAELIDLGSFKKVIKENNSLILKLKEYELEGLNEKELSNIQELLLEVFSSLDIMKSKAKIVGVSKTLAHLIPDLVPPIDRENINYFIYGNRNIPTNPEQEKNRFWEIFKKFYFIRNETNISKKNYIFREFNTSIPKMIDNAIWGYVREEKRNSNKNNRKVFLNSSKPRSDNGVPIWKMVEDAANNLGAKFSNKDIKDFIINKYGHINKNTIQCMIYTLTVNNKARVNWGFSQKVRIANSKYDLLFKNTNSTLEKFNPKKPGVWEIIKSGGKFRINQISE